MKEKGRKIGKAPTRVTHLKNDDPLKLFLKFSNTPYLIT